MAIISDKRGTSSKATKSGDESEASDDSDDGLRSKHKSHSRHERSTSDAKRERRASLNEERRKPESSKAFGLINVSNLQHC